MKNDDLLQTILESYDNSSYPEAFLLEYDIMECLSDQNGICTFLVQKKDGENCIAKCYDKLRWGISDNSAILHNLGIGVQTPDFISPYYSTNAAEA